MRGRCSALVRVSADRSTLLVGHTTWGSYAEGLRIVKLYDLDLGARARRVMFSSYPGPLSPCAPAAVPASLAETGRAGW